MSVIGRPRQVLIVDDHEIVRKGASVVLQHSPFRYEITEAASGNEALQLLRRQSWDVVILDLTLPDRNGLEILREIKLTFPQLPVLVLSGHGDADHALRSFRAGASAYVDKASAASHLRQAMDQILEGRRYFPPDVAARLAEELVMGESALPEHRLSEREREILALIGAGRTNHEISQLLSISVKTVSTHRANILAKLGLQTTAELIRYALSHGLA